MGGTIPPRNDPSPLPTIAGYEVLEELGRGGMGVVYKAIQRNLKRVVALKMILSGPHARAEERARFRAEAEIVARLQHPNIVQIYEVGEQDAAPFLALEFVGGEPLQRHIGNTPLPPQDAVRLVETVARAIHYAHLHDVVHRDLKPANILLTPDGAPKVNDFGLAKCLEGEAGLTGTGEILGTPSYMAPEQAEGKGKGVGPATDVYGLGAILYRLLTGRPPFKGDSSLETLHQVLGDEPVAPRRLRPKIPRDLETICLKCLHKEPGKRYASAEALAEDLGRFLAGEPIRARPLGSLGRLTRWVRRYPVVAGLTGLLFLLLTAAAVAGTLAAVAFNRVAERETLAHREAEDRARDYRQELVRRYVAGGARRAEERDLFGSLLWLAKGQRLEEDDPARQRIHQARFATVERLCPRLVQVCSHEGIVSHAAFSPDGRYLVTASYDRSARVWDLARGTFIALPHKGVVYHAEFSPDGRRVVTASWDHTARVWHSATGKPVTPPLWHADLVWQAVFSPDGSRVVTASEDKTAVVWDSRTGARVAGPMKHPQPLHQVSFSPDGKRILTSGCDDKARLWDAATGAPCGPPLGHAGGVLLAQFSRDGRLIFTASADHTARLWSAGTGQPLTGPLEHDGAVSGGAFSPDGRRLLTVSQEEVRVWAVATGKLLGRSRPHGAGIWHLAISPDGRRATAAGGDTVCVLDAFTGALALPPLHHNGLVRYGGFSPDGRRVATATGPTAQVWDLATDHPLTLTVQHEGSLSGAWFAPTADRILTAGSDGSARLWDAVTGAPAGPTLEQRHAIRCAAFSPNRKRLVTGGDDHTARVWDAATGAPVGPPLRHGGPVTCASWGPDGRLVLTAGEDHTARLWDAETGDPVAQAMTHAEKVTTAAFSPDGRLVLTASTDDTARLWDAATGRPHGPMLRHTGAIKSAGFSPDGKRLVTSSSDRTARLWTTDGTAVGQPMQHATPVRFVTFSRDGRFVVTTAYGTARVWDGTTGAPVTPWLRHKNAVLCAAFSPDGRWVATGADDHTAGVWGATTGQPLTPPLPHDGPVAGVAFSPDGARLLTACGDGCARLWRLDLAPPARPVADLRTYAELLNGSQLDETDDLVPLDGAALRAAWESLRAKYPEDFRSAPEDVRAWHRQEAAACARRGLWREVVRHLDPVIAAGSGRWGDHVGRGRAHAELGRWAEAALDFAAAGAGDPRVHYQLVLTRLAAGDGTGHGKACAWLGEHLGRTKDPHAARWVSRALVLAPTDRATAEGAVRLAEGVLAGDPHDPRRLGTLGAALYRAGKWKEAARRLVEAIRIKDDRESARAWFFLAMAQHRLGDHGEARRSLDRAVRQAARGELPWEERLEEDLLRREAVSIVGKGDLPGR